MKFDVKNNILNFDHNILLLDMDLFFLCSIHRTHGDNNYYHPINIKQQKIYKHKNSF